MDAKSKWTEERARLHSRRQRRSLQLRIYGYPEICVSDNASIFISEEFAKFCKEHGNWQKFIAPEYAATNGLAEKSVQTFKRWREGIR